MLSSANHPPLLRPGDWYACDHPERRWDYNALANIDCKACMIAALAATVTNGSTVAVFTNRDATHSEYGSLRDMVHRALEELDA